MILFLYGSDGYRLKTAVAETIDKYKQKRKAVDVFVVDLEEGKDPSDLSNLTKTASFFDDKKIIVVKNAFPSGLGDKIADVIEDRELISDPNNLLIFAENNSQKELSSKNKRLWKLLSDRQIQSQSFEPLSGNKLEAWAGKNSIKAGLNLNKQTIAKLVENTGGDSWFLVSEISKLASFAKFNSDKVLDKDCEALFSVKEDKNIFGLLDAVSARNKLKAIALVEDRLFMGEDPAYLVSRISSQIRNLIIIRDLMERAVPYSKIPSLTGLHPYVVKKAYSASGNFSLDDLKKAFNRLAELDLDSKNGIINAEDGLYGFILEL